MLGVEGTLEISPETSFLINQTFWWFEVLSAKFWKQSQMRPVIRWCFWVFFFLDSIYKNLILTSQGNSGLPQSKIIIIEKEWAGLVLAPELYSIHLRLIFFSPFAIELNTFFMHVSRKQKWVLMLLKRLFFLLKAIYIIETIINIYSLFTWSVP